MSRILGISCYFHDAAAALLEDGMLVAAAEEERFTRVKHDPRFPRRAIDFCLRRAGIQAADLDYVVFYEKPLVKLERILVSTLRTFPRSWRALGDFLPAWMDEKLWVRARIQEELGIARERVLFTEHHASHAASAFFCSPFAEAAVLTADGVGEWCTASLGHGRADWGDGGGNRYFTSDRETHYPHSLGLLYSAFTEFLGFEVNEGEYKVMGMAAYGEPRFEDRVRRVVQVHPDGSFALDLSYFAFQYDRVPSYTRRFEALFGAPRPAGLPFSLDGPDAARNRHWADVAASLQRVVEEAMLASARELHRTTGAEALCLAGGLGLNAVANGRLMRDGPFRDLFVQPAAGDAGGAVGAALYACHVLLGEPRRYVMETPYLGDDFGQGEAVDAARAAGLRVEILDDAALVERTVEALAAQRVVGWAHGRFEWGPRALGNRSILADPSTAAMRDRVNRSVKFREPFRPFAPVFPECATQTLFDLPGLERQYPARFMQVVLPYREGAAERIPAVDHQGTARPQTTRAEWNPRYHAVVEGFRDATGVPALLNTSFNLRGEPMVASPADAVSTFQRSGLDLLVMDHALVTRND